MIELVAPDNGQGSHIQHSDSSWNLWGPDANAAIFATRNRHLLLDKQRSPCCKHSDFDLKDENVTRQEACAASDAYNGILHLVLKTCVSHCMSNKKVSLQLRGGGKSRTDRNAPSHVNERSALVTAGKELKLSQHKNLGDRGSRERSAMLSELVAGMEVDEPSLTRKLSIQRVEQLRKALAKKDKTAISNALEKVGLHRRPRTSHI